MSRTDIGDVLAFDLGLGPQDEPVAQHRERDGLHVFVREEVPALEDGAARRSGAGSGPPAGSRRAMSGWRRLSSASWTMYSNSVSAP